LETKVAAIDQFEKIQDLPGSSLPSFGIDMDKWAKVIQKQLVNMKNNKHAMS
jgi:hypothetical protein